MVTLGFPSTWRVRPARGQGARGSQEIRCIDPENLPRMDCSKEFVRVSVVWTTSSKFPPTQSKLCVPAEYKKTRRAIILIQAYMRAARLRVAYLRKRRAIIVFQAFTRGWAAREFVKELRAKRKAEEEKKKRLEREKREREARERGENMMEESFLQAQRELFALARKAEMKAAEIIKPSGSDNSGLDNMFKYLGDSISTPKKDENSILEQVPRTTIEIDESITHFPLRSTPRWTCFSPKSPKLPVSAPFGERREFKRSFCSKKRPSKRPR